MAVTIAESVNDSLKFGGGPLQNSPEHRRGSAQGAMGPQRTAFRRLRRAALSFPEAREDFPWGESAFKVRGKTFLFMRESANGLSLSVKLPRSREFAPDYPFTQATGYGLGKSGWVTAGFAPGEKPPLDVLEAWIGESYRAIAPKALTKTLDD